MLRSKNLPPGRISCRKESSAIIKWSILIYSPPWIIWKTDLFNWNERESREKNQIFHMHIARVRRSKSSDFPCFYWSSVAYNVLNTFFYVLSNEWEGKKKFQMRWAISGRSGIVHTNRCWAALAIRPSFLNGQVERVAWKIATLYLSFALHPSSMYSWKALMGFYYYFNLHRIIFDSASQRQHTN